MDDQLRPGERSLFESAATALYEEIATQGGMPRRTRASPTAVPTGRPSTCSRRSAWSPSTRARDVGRRRSGRRAVAGRRPAGPAGSRAHRRVGPVGAGLPATSRTTWRRSPGLGQGPVHRAARRGHRALHHLRRGRRLRGAADRAAADGPRHRAASRGRRARGGRPAPRASRCARSTSTPPDARSATHKYVAAVTAEGAQVRTLDEFFDRLIVVDRRLAIVPGPGTGERSAWPYASRRWCPTSSTSSSGRGSGPARSPTARRRSCATSTPSSGR